MKKLVLSTLIAATGYANAAPISLSEIVNNTQPIYNNSAAVWDGLHDAYDGFQYLQNYGLLSVSREVFTLEDIYSYGVYDTFTNNTGSTINSTISYYTNLGSDGQSYVNNSTDFTYVTNETQLGRDPAVAFTFGNNQWTRDNATFTNHSSYSTRLFFDIEIDPNETISLLTFGSLYKDSVANSLDDLANAQQTALLLSSDPLSQGVSSFMIDNAINYGAYDVPEPATFALLGLGLAGLGFMRKKSNK